MAPNKDMAPNRDDTKPILVQFENGLLKDEEKTNVEFHYLRSMKSSKRILVASTENLTYTGNVLQKQQNLVKFYVGVIDKRTSTIENVEAVQFCTLKPKVEEQEKRKSLPLDLSYRQKSDTLVEAFGSSKQKRLASSRKRNENVHESINDKVASAAKKLFLESRTPWTPGVDNEVDSLFLPRRNVDAKNPSEIYSIDDIIPSHDYQLLKKHAMDMIYFDELELISWSEENKYPAHVIRALSQLSQLPTSSSERVKKGCHICYLNYLIQFDKVTYKDLSQASRDSCPGVPGPFKETILEKFTHSASESGKIRSRSQKLKDKLHCYVFILALMIDNYDLNCNLLLKDLKLGFPTACKLLRAIGCNVITRNWRPSKVEGAIPAEKVMRAVLKTENEREKKKDTDVVTAAALSTPKKTIGDKTNVKNEVDTSG